MSRIIIISAVYAILSIGVVFSQDQFDRAQQFFQTYVSEDGQVNYSQLVKDPVMLNESVYDIAHTGMQGRSDEYKAAFYINSYNILAIKNVVDNWPVSNPLEVDGFFDKTTFTIASESLTLNEIENLKLRRDFDDPAIHFAVVCAGSGCPPLKRDAMLPSNVRDRLNELAVQALNSPRMVVVDYDAQSVWISKIFEWYQVDFGSNTAEVIGYINQYRKNQIPGNYKVNYLEYDWSLNGK